MGTSCPPSSSSALPPHPFTQPAAPAVILPGPRAFREIPMQSMRSLARLGPRLQTAWQQRAQLRSERDLQWNYLTESWTQLLAERKKLQTAEDRGFSHCLP